MRVLFFIAGLLASVSVAQAVDNYRAKVDLNNVQDDYLFVEVWVPDVTAETIEYHMPKIVPGTYSISDFGRFLSEFKAVDENGKELTIEVVSVNTWRIKDATRLKKISYWVEDSFDSEQENVIFEPAGTNIEEGKNYILNTFGFFGYLEGMKDRGYEVEVVHPDGFYGASSLPKISAEGNTDIYRIQNYVNLADCPIMYSVPDTATINVGGSEVLISVYSPNDVMTAADVLGMIRPVLEASEKYLGGKLPVDKYAFLIYLMDGASQSGGMGALEHMTSSVYTLPELKPDLLGQTIKDVAAHEFFHIVTPLNIHSSEIGDFDFIDPKMSKHLWLYEGVTEYTAHHVQVQNGLIDVETFFDVMREKMNGSDRYKQDITFTALSTQCLGEHEDQYGNVYEKGALIGMCLDLLLLKESKGEYGMPDLMAELSKKYGPEMSFQDDALFDEIVAMTYPSVKTFFEKHVDGAEPLPFKEHLAFAGVKYEEHFMESTITLGNIQLGFDPEAQTLYIVDTNGMNKFGKDLGYKNGDRLKKINGTVLELATIQNVMEDFISNTPEGEKVTITVERKDKKGRWKEKTLKAKSMLVEKQEEHSMQMMESPTAEQQAVFAGWTVQ